MCNLLVFKKKKKMLVVFTYIYVVYGGDITDMGSFFLDKILNHAYFGRYPKAPIVKGQYFHHLILDLEIPFLKDGDPPNSSE
jgi:hypothetical protein